MGPFDLGDPVLLGITTCNDTTGVAEDAATVTITVTLPDGTSVSVTPDHSTGSGVYSKQWVGTTQYGWYTELVTVTGTATVTGGTRVRQFEVTGPLTLDPSTTIGRVRLLATDVDPSAPLFTDPQIQAFLDLEGQNVRLAAAQALDTIASSEALVSKKVRTADGLATDGPAVAAELRARAQQLREQVADGAGLTGADDSAFQVVTFDWS